MPFALVIFGLIFIVTGVKGTTKALGRQVVSDFSGPQSFLYWFIAIGAVGALGAVPAFKNFSRAFMTLIIVAMVIRNGGVFDKLIEAIKTGPIAPERDAASSGNNLPGTSIPVPSPLAVLNPVGALADIVKGVGATASQSIATSRAQQSNPAANASALTRLLGAIF